MGLIDTHTHLEGFARRGVLEPALARAREHGLEAMVTVGTSLDDWDLYRGLAAGHPGFVHYSAGLHPCAVGEDWERHLGALPGYWEGGGPSPVALGEVGLDRFHLPKDPVEAEAVFGRQKAAFDAGLALARRLGCPVIIHSRGAFAECVERIDAAGVDWAKVVFHCFAEGPEEMEVLKGRGAFGSFTGILTYRSAGNVRDAARVQGLERLMLETDAPYLTPQPHRGKPNEPAYVSFTADTVAEIFGVSRGQVEAATTSRARRFFGLA